MTTRTHSVPQVSTPADADPRSVGPWQRDGGEGDLFRRFTGHTALVGRVEVAVSGEQYADGGTSRVVELAGEYFLTAHEARGLAAALIECAEQIEAEHRRAS